MGRREYMIKVNMNGKRDTCGLVVISMQWHQNIRYFYSVNTFCLICGGDSRLLEKTCVLKIISLSFSIIFKIYKIIKINQKIYMEILSKNVFGASSQISCLDLSLSTLYFIGYETCYHLGILYFIEYETYYRLGIGRVYSIYHNRKKIIFI